MDQNAIVTVVSGTVTSGVNGFTYSEIFKVEKTVFRLSIRVDKRSVTRSFATTERLGRSGWQKFDSMHYSQMDTEYPVLPEDDVEEEQVVLAMPATMFEMDRDAMVARAADIYAAYSAK